MLFTDSCFAVVGTALLITPSSLLSIIEEAD
jgi:hypothetical protein